MSSADTIFVKENTFLLYVSAGSDITPSLCVATESFDTYIGFENIMQCISVIEWNWEMVSSEDFQLFLKREWNLLPSVLLSRGRLSKLYLLEKEVVNE